MVPMFAVTIGHSKRCDLVGGGDDADFRQGIDEKAPAVRRPAVVTVGGGGDSLEGEGMGVRVVHQPAYDGRRGL
jgi:hypothetical protein